MKERMFKYFSANNTYRYIDVIEDLVKQYNQYIRLLEWHRLKLKIPLIKIKCV